MKIDNISGNLGSCKAENYITKGGGMRTQVNYLDQRLSMQQRSGRQAVNVVQFNPYDVSLSSDEDETAAAGSNG